jgi:glycosyltransferase involved in cell wall biosynthesis
VSQPPRQKTATVLFISHSKEIGGAELYLEGLLRYTMGANFRAELVCRKDSVLDPWAARIAAAGAQVHRLDLKAPGEYLALQRRIRRATIVHLVLAYPVGKYQLAAALLTAGAGTPLVITHQLVIDLPAIKMSGLRRRFWAIAFRQYGRLARRNIASSSAGLELLRRHGFPAARTELIYNGADAKRFSPLTGAERDRVRAAMAVNGEPWPADALLACTVARLTPQKGLFDLLDAVPAVVARSPQTRFVIVGDGELREPMTKRIAAAGLQRQVRLAGSRSLDEVAAWLGAADLFVLSSRYEGLPLALMEAMAAGCPVVATDVGGVGEVVVDGSVGWLVPAADPRRLAEAINRIVGDPTARLAMASAGRARVLASFSVEACYEKTTVIYRGLTSSERAPARA